MVDRIGYAARQGLAQPNISADPSQPPIISPTDVATVSILPGSNRRSRSGRFPLPPGADDAVLAQLAASQASDDTSTLTTDAHDFLTLYNETQLASFLVQSSQAAANFAFGSVAAYYDRPRITIYSEQYDPKQQTFSFALDLLRNTMRVVVAPGQNATALQVFNGGIGNLDTMLEGDAVPTLPGVANTGTANVFQQAAAQGIPLVAIAQQNLSTLQTLAISADAKAYITAAVDQGKSSSSRRRSRSAIRRPSVGTRSTPTPARPPVSWRTASTRKRSSSAPTKPFSRSASLASRRRSSYSRRR